MQKVSKYFWDHELVSEAVYDSRFPNTWFIDKNLLVLLDALREEFGPITVNNWKWSGAYQHSGFREPKCPVGGSLSQHRFGKAADLKFKDYDVQDVYAKILAHPRRWMDLGLTTLENINATPTWLHIDMRMTNLDKILIVNP